MVSNNEGIKLMKYELIAKNTFQTGEGKTIKKGEVRTVVIDTPNVKGTAIFSDPRTRKEIMKEFSGWDKKSFNEFIKSSNFEVRDVTNVSLAEIAKGYKPLSNRDLNKPLW